MFGTNKSKHRKFCFSFANHNQNRKTLNMGEGGGFTIVKIQKHIEIENYAL